MIVVATGALALTAAPLAQASNSDRDCDRMPDREDSDRDGLSNHAEYCSGHHPRSADSDHDGVRDGREDADHDGVRNDREHYDDTEGHSDDS